MEQEADSLSLSTILSGNGRGTERREIRVRRPKTARRRNEERRKGPRDKKGRSTQIRGHKMYLRRPLFPWAEQRVFLARGRT